MKKKYVKPLLMEFQNLKDITAGDSSGAPPPSPPAP